MIAIAPHVFFEPTSLTALNEARHAFQQGNLRRRLQIFHGDNTEMAFHGWNDTWRSAAFATWDIRATLPGITAPVLAMRGGVDPFGTQAQLEAIKAGVSATCRALTLAGGGHMPHHENRVETLREIEGFLRQRLDRRGMNTA